MTKDASPIGAVARVESSSLLLTGDLTVITREKGDTRYLSQSKFWRFDVDSTSSTSGLPSGWTKSVSISGDIATVLINPNGDFDNFGCLWADVSAPMRKYFLLILQIYSLYHPKLQQRGEYQITEYRLFSIKTHK